MIRVNLRGREHQVEAQTQHGASISRIVISGGAGPPSAVRQVLSDTTDVSIVHPETEEPVLLGAAMLGPCAAGHH